MSGETRKEYTRWRTHAVLLFLFFPSFLSSFSYRNDSSLLMAIRFVFSLNFQPDNLDWYCRIRKKLERSISRRTKYTLELGFLKFTFKDIWDWDKWMIPFWSCFKIVHIPFTLQFSFKNILIFHRILKTKKKKTFGVSRTCNLISLKESRTCTSTFGPRSPRASMERLWIVEGMLEEQLTSPHSLRVLREKEPYRKETTHVRSCGTRKTTDPREISRGGGIQRKTVWGGGSTTEKDGPKESTGGEEGAVDSAVVGIDHGSGTRTVRQGRRQGRESRRKREGRGGRPSRRGKLWQR